MFNLDTPVAPPRNAPAVRNIYDPPAGSPRIGMSQRQAAIWSGRLVPANRGCAPTPLVRGEDGSWGPGVSFGPRFGRPHGWPHGAHSYRAFIS